MGGRGGGAQVGEVTQKGEVLHRKGVFDTEKGRVTQKRVR